MGERGTLFRNSCVIVKSSQSTNVLDNLPSPQISRLKKAAGLVNSSFALDSPEDCQKPLLIQLR